MLSDIFRGIFIALIHLQTLLLLQGCNAQISCEQLTEGLRFERHLSLGPEESSSNSPDAFYILGGKQDDLQLAIQQVGRLYAAKKARKVFFLHRPGITEFAPKLGRNYTNDEWAAEHLKREGVEAEHLEFVVVPSLFFSTFAEAQTVSSLARSRGFRRLILVTSRHHTARTWNSFSQCNRNNRLDLYIYGTEAKIDARELFMELLKRSTYRILVFPLDRLGIRF